jgi:hypothetical protein
LVLPCINGASRDKWKTPDDFYAQHYFMGARENDSNGLALNPALAPIVGGDFESTVAEPTYANEELCAVINPTYETNKDSNGEKGWRRLLRTNEWGDKIVGKVGFAYVPKRLVDEVRSMNRTTTTSLLALFNAVNGLRSLAVVIALPSNWVTIIVSLLNLIDPDTITTELLPKYSRELYEIGRRCEERIKDFVFELYTEDGDVLVNSLLYDPVVSNVGALGALNGEYTNIRNTTIYFFSVYRRLKIRIENQMRGWIVGRALQDGLEGSRIKIKLRE